VTTIDSAAAWGIRRKALLAALIAGLGVGLGGCETGASLFGGGSTAAPDASIAAQTPPPVAETAKIAVAPVFGPSETIAKSLHGQMVAAIEQQKITVAKSPTDKSEYTLRGYFLSSKKGNKTSISYVWDVTDPTGKRLNRIAGEELVASASGRDPWTSVTPQVGEKITSKTASNLATWLPTVAPASPPAAGGAIPPPTSGAAPNNGNIPMASASPPVSGPVSGPMPPSGATATPAVAAGPAVPPTATGSIGRDGVAAMVPTVTGAPGGGSVELTNAIQQALTKNGVKLGAGNGQAYRIEGRVIVGQVANGKQPIEIEWQVKDPSGKKLGTVSQKNNVAAGSLDGPWGKTADMVADAAVKRIVELLPSEVRQAKAG
jgi:hypothetical protein